MICNLQGQVPDDDEIARYIENVEKIHRESPSNLLEIQLYTVIRETVLPDVEPLPHDFLESVKERIIAALPVPVRVF